MAGGVVVVVAVLVVLVLVVLILVVVVVMEAQTFGSDEVHNATTRHPGFSPVR